MNEELEAILAPHGWCAPPDGAPVYGRPHLRYWGLRPSIYAEGMYLERPVMINLLTLAGYDARPLHSSMIAVWV